MRSATVLNFEKSDITVTMWPRSCSAKPAQSVAQNTKLCSFAIDSTLPASISSALPSRPWPYSDGRAFAGAAGSSATRGISQT